MKYATGFLEESYPFGFHCYYTYDEAQQLATSDEFLNQGIDELLEDAAYEMRQHTDATRRIMKLLFEVYPERQASGEGFSTKEWYTLGLNFGIVFNLIATQGNHAAADEDTSTDDDESADADASTE